jgi:threonine dehydratase
VTWTPPVSLADVEAAARAIAGPVVRTAATESQTLSEILGCTVIVKPEVFQFTASYKERGARNRLLALGADERAAGVVAVSAGNHAQAVARHASLLGIPATIVMPRSTPFVKVVRTRHLGADVELCGDDLAAAMARGQELVAGGRTFVHPFDDPLVIAGQGTVGLELLDDRPDLDCIVVPVGGGGLVSGIAVVAAERAPHVEVVGVQSESWASLVPGGSTGGPTIAEGIAVGAPGALTGPIVEALVPTVLAVSEPAIEDGVDMLLEIEKLVVEGAGAAGIAAVASFRERFAGRTVAVVLTGGNIDPRLLAQIIERGLVRSGRLTRIRIELDDRPGTLAALLTVVSAAGANLVEVQHQRLFVDVAAREADVDLTVECMDAAHRDAVLAAVRDAGYRFVSFGIPEPASPAPWRI